MPHESVDVSELGCDFFVFSRHKLFGPTGIGMLWGRREWLERFPRISGGDMIERVDFEGTTYKAIPENLRRVRRISLESSACLLRLIISIIWIVSGRTRAGT